MQLKVLCSHLDSSIKPITNCLLNPHN